MCHPIAVRCRVRCLQSIVANAWSRVRGRTAVPITWFGRRKGSFLRNGYLVVHAIDRFLRPLWTSTRELPSEGERCRLENPISFLVSKTLSKLKIFKDRMKSIALALKMLANPSRRRNFLALGRLLIAFVVMVFVFAIAFHWLMQMEGQEHSWATGYTLPPKRRINNWTSSVH